MGSNIDLNPVTRITAGCIGKPGSRTFYIQARKGTTLVTLLCEKLQIQQLAKGITKFVHDLQLRFPDLDPAVPKYSDRDMELEEPVDPIFRVGEIGLGYDEDQDKLILVAKEILNEDEEDDDEYLYDTATVRLWASRSQMLAMGSYGTAVSKLGRPICGNCLKPINPQGHFCPKSNGHKN